MEVSFTDAALGATVKVPMLDESEEAVELPPGSQPGDVITLRGKGVPRLDGRGRGALHVQVQVKVPRKLSARAKSLLTELDSELRAEAEKKRASAG